ncbi:MAG TPA: Ig-like domain-containing protein [Acidobacteriaceae bacterium]|nr:Ig-like domain-containing protein [Acidobacteriaceae bacterium]
MLASSPAHAQTVFVADTHIHHCDPHFHDWDHDRDHEDADLVCNERKAFSLSAFQNGLIHLPVNGHEHRRFVMINDTGAPVKLLQFSFLGTLDADAHLHCRVNGTAHKSFESCDISGWTPATDKKEAGDHDRDAFLQDDCDKDHRGDHDSGIAVDASPEFSYIAGTAQAGIPAGAYFDIRADGFRAHEGDKGYLTGLGITTVASSCTAAAANATAGSSSGSSTSYGRLPAICWPDPAPITYGAPLSSVQLDATAGTAGTFAYSPSAGAILNPGTQTLTATFTPANRTSFATVTADAKLTVNQASQTVLTAAANPDPNNPVILTVNVTTQPGGQPATGYITIYDTTNWVQAAVQLNNGQATWVVPASLTSLTVYAVYAGTGDVAGSTSAPLNGPAEMAILYPGN